MAFENLKKAGITYLLGKLKEHLEATYLKIANAILTVNGTGPDSYGNVQINRVNYAGDLESSFTQNSNETFLQRTTGGAASVMDGDAWLSFIMGNSIHEGFVAEELDMDVRPISEESPITATIDRDTFFANASLPSSPITLTYTTGWSTDPTTYGVTVTGSPSAGDQIIISYVREVPGTITTANPSSFVSTGWNLYQSANGYAKVVRYSDEYGYKISGDYTGLQFSETVTGEKSSLEDEGGMFNPPSDGYVWVTGGNAANTAIWPTWSDWTDSYPGSFAGYAKTEIDLSDVMTTYFTHGLCRVGNVRDEINLSLGVAIVRIEVMENNATNMAAAIATGRLYEYDENYIYLVKATASTNSIDVSGAYAANQHGIEYFTGTTIAVEAETIYGMNLKNKLERDTLTMSQQTLTSQQKAQVRQNIGLGDAATKGVANNLTTNASGSVLDARQGKALNDRLVLVERRVTTQYYLTAQATTTIELEANSRYFIIINSTASTIREALIVAVSSAGAVGVTRLVNASNITLDTSENKKLKITNNATNSGRAYVESFPN